MKKNRKNILLVSLFALLLSSCGLDNYDEPESLLTGKISYNNKTIGVKGSNGSTELQLWQDEYELHNDYIGVNVTQNGTFSALLFDGEYKLVARDNNGPWENRHDTIRITVRGNTVQDYPVVLYYTIDNETFVLNGKTLTATFDLTKISQDKNVEAIYLYVNKTQYVDNSTEVQNVKITENIAAGTVTLSMELNDNTLSQKFLYARVAVQIASVPDYLYSVGSKQIK